VIIDSFCLKNKEQFWHPNGIKGIQRLSDIVDFLSHLRSLDAQLTVQDDRLACTAPKGVLNAELTAQLKARKSEIIEFLRSRGIPARVGIRTAAGGGDHPRFAPPAGGIRERSRFLG